MPQLAELIRKKYPGSYDDMSDEDLEKSVVAKYPEYKDLATPEKGIISKIGDTVSTFMKDHPTVRRIAEEMLTGSSPELEDLKRNKSIESLETGRDSESNKAELSRLQGGGNVRTLDDPSQEKSLLPSFKQPETFAGGFLNSLYEDFVKPLATPSGILGSVSLEGLPSVRNARLHSLIDESANAESQKLLTAPKTRFSVDEGGNALDRTVDIPIKSVERPYKSPESFSTAEGDTDRAKQVFDASVRERNAAPPIDPHQEMSDALSVKNEFEPWRGVRNIKEGLANLGENFLGGRDEPSSISGIDWGPAAKEGEELLSDISDLKGQTIMTGERLRDLLNVEPKEALARGWIIREDDPSGASGYRLVQNRPELQEKKPFVNPFEKPVEAPKSFIPEAVDEKSLVKQSESEAPRLAGVQDHGNGIVQIQFDRNGKNVTVDDIKAMLPNHKFEVTKFNQNALSPHIQKFRLDVRDANGRMSSKAARALSDELGGQFHDWERAGQEMYDRMQASKAVSETKPVIEQPKTQTEQEKFAQSLGGKNGIVELQGGYFGAKPTEGMRVPNSGPAGAAVDKLLDSLQASKGMRTKIDNARRVEQAQRLAKFEGVKATGQAGAASSLGKLKGEYSGINRSPLQLNQQETDSLFTAIKQSNITPFEKARGYTALFKILEGGSVPQRSELKLLDDVFGNGFAEQVIQMHGGLGAVGVNIAKTANTMKSMMSSVDLSAPLRQGFGLIHKPEWRDSFGQMFKYLVNPKAYDAAMQAIEKRPNYLLGRESGLFLAKPEGLTSSEEAFASSYVHQLPIVRNIVGTSERAYTGFLNKLRSDTFDNLVEQARRGGSKVYETVENIAEDGTKTKSLVPTDVTRNIAKFVNNASGRGPLGKLENFTHELNAVIWSPRLISSRLNALNPKYYAELDPFTRKEAIKSLLAMAAAGTTIGSLAAVAGAKVGTNPLSADFGKARFGNKVLDPWAGFQQPIVAAARFISGKTDVRNQDRATTAGRFAVNKLSPAAGLAYDLMSAQKFTGGGDYKDRFGNQKSVQTETAKRFIPIFVQDMTEIFKEDPNLAQSIGLSIPAVFGAGTQDYAESKPNNSLQRLRRPSLK